MSQAVDTFLVFIKNEIEKVENGENLSSRATYTEHLATLNESNDIVLDEYLEPIFRAQQGGEIDDVIEYLEEIAGILEDIIEDE